MFAKVALSFGFASAFCAPVASAGDTYEDSTMVSGDQGTEASSCKDARQKAAHADDLCMQNNVKNTVVARKIDRDCSCQSFRGEDQTTSSICQLNVVVTCKAAAPSTAQIPGVPDDKTCRDALAASKAPAATQQELTAQAGANAMLAICDMGHAYASLVRLPAFASAASKLDATRTAWDAYLQAHRVERSPHANERGYYGSSRPMCENMDERAMASGRGQDLRALGACRESNAMAAQAKQAARIADAALNDSYRKMRAASATDPPFLAAFQRAEIAWVKYRDGQVDLAGAGTGGPESACAQRELERVTRARTQVIQVWANAQEGDVCSMR